MLYGAWRSVPDMHEAHVEGRQLRDGVVVVRDAVVAPGLVGDVLGQLGAGDARLAERVQRGGVAVVAEFGGREGGDGSA